MQMRSPGLMLVRSKVSAGAGIKSMVTALEQRSSAPYLYWINVRDEVGDGG